MYQSSYKSLLKSAAVATGVIVLCASGPASSDERIEHLGPVSAHEPILTAVGEKHVIAFYTPGSGRCALQAVVSDPTDAQPAKSATRVRVSLEPGQIVHIDTVDEKTLGLKCGEHAKTLSISDNDERVAFGMTFESPDRVVKANASNF